MTSKSYPDAWMALLYVEHIAVQACVEGLASQTIIRRRIE